MAFGLIGLAIIGIWQVISFLIRIYWILKKDNADKKLYFIYIILAAVIVPVGYLIISSISTSFEDDLYPIFFTLPIAIYFNVINWKVDTKYSRSVQETKRDLL